MLFTNGKNAYRIGMLVAAVMLCILLLPAGPTCSLFLQSMPPGTLLYSTVVEEAAKIDQVIFWVDQGQLYPEAAAK